MSREVEATVRGIFREYGASYREAHSLPLHMLKVMSAIEKCRTSDLGSIKYSCDNRDCDYTVICYKPCGNRHCPQCDFLKKEKWLFNRKKDVLPVVYYHVVFSIPDDLNPIALVNQQVVYDILFRAAKETLLDLCDDPQHMGAHIGILAVLHTWGQTMLDHPHLHCLVPGGGLSKDGDQWVEPKKTTAENDFFIHVNIISDLFKKKFLFYFKKAYYSNELQFVGKTAYLNDRHAFKKLIDQLYAKDWVTFCKSVFSSRQKVLEYLGRYAYRVAISNYRILAVREDRVYFRWHDNRDGTDKIMDLHVFEFIRRFLLHVLPTGYFKIRYYGILASRNLKTKLVRCKSVLVVNINKKTDADSVCDWREFMYQFTGIDIRFCPKCNKGRLIMMDNYSPP